MSVMRVTPLGPPIDDTLSLIDMSKKKGSKDNNTNMSRPDISND